MGVVKKALKLLHHREVGNVQKYLRSWNKDLIADELWNLYLINPWTPLICAHMDTVRDKEDADKVSTIKYETQYEEGDVVENAKTIIRGDNIVLGADDRAGVAIAMELYEMLWNKVSLLFTVGEESGGVGSKHFVKEHKDLVESCTYAIVPDRKWDSDLICTLNGYGSKDFEKAVLEHLELFWFKSVHGVWSDANQLCNLINCFNISVGYYGQHTSKEYLIPDEMEHTLAALKYLIEQYNESLPKPVVTESKPYSYGRTYMWGCWQAHYADRWLCGWLGWGEDSYFDREYYFKEAEELARQKREKWFALDGSILRLETDIVMYNSLGEAFVLPADQYYLEREDLDDDEITIEQAMLLEDLEESQP